jgi:hypothetical protein
MPPGDIDSPFQLQEYIAHLVADDTHNVNRVVELPRWKRDPKGKARENDSDLENDQDAADTNSQDEYEYVERDVWLYEQLRFAHGHVLATSYMY